MFVRRSTRISRRRQVPLEITRQLRFRRGHEAVPAVFRKGSPTLLDPQTFRMIRELTPDSAALLDGFAGPYESTDWASVDSRTRNYYERWWADYRA